MTTRFGGEHAWWALAVVLTCAFSHVRVWRGIACTGGGQMQDEVREMNERKLTNPNAAKRGEMREMRARRTC